MKQGIHPQYVECTVTCSCGNTFKTHATVSEMKVELCNECHPFYTGQQKFVDTGGRVQRFADKFGGAAAAQLKKAEEAKAAKAAKAAEAEAARKAAAEAKAAAKAVKALEKVPADEKLKLAAEAAEKAAKAAAAGELIPETFEDYLNKWVYGCKDQAELLDKIGGSRLMRLKNEPHLGYSTTH